MTYSRLAEIEAVLGRLEAERLVKRYVTVKRENVRHNMVPDEIIPNPASPPIFHVTLSI